MLIRIEAKKAIVDLQKSYGIVPKNPFWHHHFVCDGYRTAGGVMAVECSGLCILFTNLPDNAHCRLPIING